MVTTPLALPPLRIYLCEHRHRTATPPKFAARQIDSQNQKTTQTTQLSPNTPQIRSFWPVCELEWSVVGDTRRASQRLSLNLHRPEIVHFPTIFPHFLGLYDESRKEWDRRCQSWGARVRR